MAVASLAVMHRAELAVQRPEGGECLRISGMCAVLRIPGDRLGLRIPGLLGSG